MRQMKKDQMSRLSIILIGVAILILIVGVVYYIRKRLKKPSIPEAEVSETIDTQPRPTLSSNSAPIEPVEEPPTFLQKPETIPLFTPRDQLLRMQQQRK